MQVDVSRGQSLRPALELAALIRLNVVESEGRLVVVVGPVGRSRRWEHLAVRAYDQRRVLAEPESNDMLIVLIKIYRCTIVDRTKSNYKIVDSVRQSRCWEHLAV